MSAISAKDMWLHLLPAFGTRRQSGSFQEYIASSLISSRFCVSFFRYRHICLLTKGNIAYERRYYKSLCSPIVEFIVINNKMLNENTEHDLIKEVKNGLLIAITNHFNKENKKELVN